MSVLTFSFGVGERFVFDNRNALQAEQQILIICNQSKVNLRTHPEGFEREFTVLATKLER